MFTQAIAIAWRRISDAVDVVRRVAIRTSSNKRPRVTEEEQATERKRTKSDEGGPSTTQDATPPQSIQNDEGPSTIQGPHVPLGKRARVKRLAAKSDLWLTRACVICVTRRKERPQGPVRKEVPNVREWLANSLAHNLPTYEDYIRDYQKKGLWETATPTKQSQSDDVALLWWQQPAQASGEIQPEMEMEIEHEIQPQIHTEIQPEIQMEIQPEIPGEIQPEIQPEMEIEIEHQIHMEIQPEIPGEIQPEIPKQVQLQIQPEIPGEIQPEIQPDAVIPVAESSQDAERRAAAAVKQSVLPPLQPEKKASSRIKPIWQDALIKAQQEVEKFDPMIIDEPAELPTSSVHMAAALELPSYQAPTYQISSLFLPPQSFPPPISFADDEELSSVTLRAISEYLDQSIKATLRSDTVPSEGPQLVRPIPAFHPSMISDGDRSRYHDIQLDGMDGVFFTLDNCDFVLKDVKTLLPGQWLNDNVINGYMKLLQERDAYLQRRPSCHFCKTFLINHIFPDYKYQNVRKWTSEKRLKNWGQKKKSILECDLVFFPINQSNVHWVLAVADLRRKKIRFYNSMGTEPRKGAGADLLLKNIARYLVDEAADKLGAEWHVSDFSFEYVRDMPQQTNASDCGVYVARTAKELSGQNTLNYTTEEMRNYRVLILKELASGHVL